MANRRLDDGVRVNYEISTDDVSGAAKVATALDAAVANPAVVDAAVDSAVTSATSKDPESDARTIFEGVTTESLVHWEATSAPTVSPFVFDVWWSKKDARKALSMLFIVIIVVCSAEIKLFRNRRRVRRRGTHRRDSTAE